MKQRLLIGLVCIGIAIILYKYFNPFVIEGLQGYALEIYNASNYYDYILNLSNKMKYPDNVTKSIADLKQAIDDVKDLNTKIIDAGNFSKDKKKAKKQRDGIKNARDKAKNSYAKARESYNITLAANPIKPKNIKPGLTTTDAENITINTGISLDHVKLALSKI